ncbi:MAG: hypothetical protein JNL48_13980 [Acidobacteria bacterium]|nr:hypothetical protein [Acidobacteriota bacterium]
MSTSARRGVWQFAFLTFVSAVGLYRLCLPVTYSGDDLQYAVVIERSVHGGLFYHPAGGQPYVPQAAQRAVELPPTLPAVNPRYLLEWPTSAFVARLWSGAGLAGDAVAAIQAYRIVVSALGLTLFFLAMARLVRSPALALLPTSGLGVAAAYFTYSTHMDQSINMVTLLVLAFYLFVRQNESAPTTGGRALLACVLAGATFYNFTAALSALAFGVGVALESPDTSIAGRTRRFVGFGLGYTLIVGVVITTAVAVFVSPASVTDPAYWRGVTFGGRPEYDVDVAVDAVRAAIGLAKSQTHFPGLAGDVALAFQAASAARQALLLAFFAAVLLILMLPFGALAARLRRPWTKRSMFLFLVAWLTAHGLFNGFWDPGFNKYWLVPLVACWAVAALALAELRQHRPRLYRPALLGTLTFVLVSFGVNLSTQFWPQSHAAGNPWMQVARDLRTASRPADLFISRRHPLDFYLSYFSRRDVVSTWLVAYDRGGDATGLKERLAERMAAHRADGGKVYAYGLEELTPAERTAQRTLLGNPPLREAWRYPGATTFYEITDGSRMTPAAP